MSNKNITRYPHTGSETISFFIDSKLVKSDTIQALLMDIGHNLEMALNMVRNNTIRVLHNNIITQTPGLSSYQKEVINFFCKYTDDEILHMAACGKVQDNDLADRILMEVLTIRLKKTIKHFLKHTILQDMDLSAEDGSSREQQLDQKIAYLQQEYPQAKSSLKHKYKSKSFEKEMVTSYIDQHFKYLEKTLQEYEQVHATPILQTGKDTDLFNLYAGWALHFCTIEEHIKQYKKYYNNTIQELMQKSHNDVVDRRTKEALAEQIRKQKNLEKQQTLVTNDANTVDTKEIDTTVHNTLENIKAQLHQTIDDQIEGLFAYIKRMAKNGRSVRVETIIEYMGDKYTEEVYNSIIQALETAGIAIETKKDKEIKEMLDDSKKLLDNTDTPRTTKIDVESTYPTFEEVKKDPNLLTAVKLVQIFKEMGYRMAFEDQFMKEANSLLEEKNSYLIKKDLIARLSKPEEIARTDRKPVHGPIYQRIPLVSYKYRLVKQGKTILWLTDRQTYNNRIQEHFNKKKINYNSTQGQAYRFTKEQSDGLADAC